MTDITRVAMWSGPRNISTAVMRSWGSRSDTIVCDEPLYAHYLLASGADHPGASEVVAHHEVNLEKVVHWLLGPLPPGKSVFYQKHMAHHLLPGMDLNWIDSLTNCFLIREPSEMITSLTRVLPNPGLAETGLPQQVDLFDKERQRTGRTPPVLDAGDVLENPERLLKLLCDSLGVDFSPAMLTWESGVRDTDGVWGKYWYEKVWKSSGFAKYSHKLARVPPRFSGLLAECRGLYERLYEHRLRVK